MRHFIILALPLMTFATPYTSPTRHSLTKRDAEVPFVLSSCEGKEDKVRKAIAQASEMAKTALSEWWDHGSHADLVATYIGFPMDSNYKENADAKLLRANLARIANLKEGWHFFGKYITVHCKDIMNKCHEIIQGANMLKGGELVHNNGGSWGEVSAFELCPVWFNTETPDKLYNDNKNWNEAALNFFENDAAKMLHEFMHTDFISEDRGHIEDVFYRPGERAYTAPIIADMVQKKFKPDIMLHNADTYSQFLSAIYFKNRYGRTIPPSKQDSFLPERQCVGGGDRYVSLDIANKHVEEFCDNVLKQYTPNTFGQFAQEWDKDKPEHVEYKFDWRTNGHLAPDEINTMCRNNLYEIFNGCDTNSNTWKFGGSVSYKVKGKTANDDVLAYEFDIAAKRDRPDPIPAKILGKCDVWYNFGAPSDTFWIYGALWAGNDHGQSQLLPNLRRCGSVENWEFTYFNEIDHKDNFEWVATGHLPIGHYQWDCVRQAVVDSGGPADIGCGGH